MGRTPTYDRGEVVRAARGVFWRTGYEGASLPELEEATGLARSSLYHAFGSKRGLYDAAVESYLDEIVRPRLVPLARDRVAPDAILDYLSGLADALRRSAVSASGCLLINSATGSLGDDAAVAGVVRAYRAELRGALGRGVDAYLPGLPPARRARLSDAVTGLVVSAFALTRVSPDEAVEGLEAAAGLLCDARGAQAS